MLLIPSFAIGRTQEIVWELSRLLDAGRIPELPVYLDSPMAKSASEIYRDHPEAYDEETDALLAGARGAARLPGPAHRPERPGVGADRAGPAAATSSSPRTGCSPAAGPWATRSACSTTRSATVLFVGYQGEGTLGGHLVRGTPTRADRRPGDAGQGDDPVARRVLRPRRRAGAARVARRLHRRAARRRPGRAARRVPRPRRPAGPGRRCCRRSTRSASTPRSPPGTRRCRWTEPAVRRATSRRR